MRPFIASLLSSIALFVAACPVHAGQVADIKSKLGDTRQHTMAMLSEPDRTVMEMHYDEALQSSKELDAMLNAALTDGTLRPIQPTLSQFKTVWEAFKKTRDGEIIPALYAGARDKARSLAQGVQAPRFKKMNELLESLPQ